MTTTDTTYLYLKDWLDQTLLWLHDDGLPNVLQNPHTQLLEMMRKAKRENRANEIWDLIEKLEELANRAGDTREQGEILINCAKIAADLENLKSALHYFQGATAEAEGDQFFIDGDSLRWVSCQVSESIPAGGFGPAGFDPQPLGFLEISEVVIEDEPYEVFSIRRPSTRRNLVDINSQSQYHTVCVTGTSMNAAKPVPILDGDFVLIQAQPDVQDNDIVVAGILGQDPRATVKRLKRRNGKIQLVPETTDPKHSEIDWEQEYDEFHEQIQIIGVVEAVFKKKPG